MTIEVSQEVYQLAQQLAARCKWDVEKVLLTALQDAESLQNEMEANRARKARMLADLVVPE